MTDLKSPSYPVIPLRDIVVFPHMVLTLFVGRKKSIAAIKHALKEESEIFLLPQKKSETESPNKEDLYHVGVVAHITQMINLPDGTVKILVEGLYRANVKELTQTKDYMEALVTPMLDKAEGEVSTALVDSLLKVFLDYADYNKKVSPDFVNLISKEKNPSKIVDLIASQLFVSVEKQQKILETQDLTERLEHLLSYLIMELDAFKLEEKVRTRVKQQMEKNHREYYLSEQIKAIQNELHQDQNSPNEMTQLKKRIEQTNFTKEAREKAEGELKKLTQMNAMSSEASIIRNYLEWLLDVPWSSPTKIKRDIKNAKKILDRDHYGLDKIKERILEHLAVQQRVGKSCGQILCLVGPPGVGKTSLGKSIAEASGRNYVRISLGGVRDEAEIRGHRRTYIGAMPGRIIQGMKRAKSSNPLFLLDEVDKLGADWRGDPTSALLEVLDPMQNNAFNDHYLEVDYDLSDVFFIATANSLNLPRPLLDRMEIIHISGYTEAEKIEIAKRHLISKQMKANGLKKTEFSISEGALRDLIRHYTNESGVRSLEREIASLARKVLKKLLTKKKTSVAITRSTLTKYLGKHKYRYGLAEKEPLVGVTTGLAWTETGGDLLTIEASVSEGKGKSVLTGKLGEVMQESIQASISYIRSRAAQFGIYPSMFMNKDIHIHVPEGATPKDGPSAGIAICTSLVSILTGIPVRSDVAMTGEITLRGRVLPIGGLKEKLLAAVRGGIKKVLIPEENKKDMEEVPISVSKALEIQFVRDIEEVLHAALVEKITPLTAEQKKKDARASLMQTQDFTLPHPPYPSGITGSKSRTHN